MLILKNTKHSEIE